MPDYFEHSAPLYGGYARRPYIRRGYKRLTGQPRSQVPTKLTRAEVSKIAKKAIYRAAETKRDLVTINTTLTNNAWYVTNLTAGISEGIASSDSIGTSFLLKNIKLRARWDVNASTDTSGALVRLMVFRAAENLTATTSAAVLQSLLFRNNSTTFNPQDFPDTDKITVFYDRVWPINILNGGPTGGGSPVDWCETVCTINKREHIRGDNASYLKTGAYYLYQGMLRDNGAVVTAGVSFIEVQTEFNDM